MRLGQVRGLLFVLLISTAGALAQPDNGQGEIAAVPKIPDYSDKARRLEAGERQGDGLYGELLTPDYPDRDIERYAREIDVVEDIEYAYGWRGLAGHYLETGQLDEALGAAYRSYQLAGPNYLKSAALAILAEAVLAQGKIRLALDIYGAAKGLGHGQDAQARHRTLVERYELSIVTVAVDAERAIPNACIVFSQKLVRDRSFHAADYVALTPPGDIDISAKGDRICLGGLEHGKSYSVTIKSGLRGAGGYCLAPALMCWRNPALIRCLSRPSMSTRSGLTSTAYPTAT